MDTNNIKLPSNVNFGFFFAGLFGILGLYFLIFSSKIYMIICFIFSLIFGIVAYLKPDLLQPLNKLWMLFGLLLGKIISPIVLGIIFFGLFTPIGLFMKVIGRDELSLKIVNSSTNWKRRESNFEFNDTFNNQF